MSAGVSVRLRYRESDVGSMQSAVLEFDEAVQVPWRPPLTVVSGAGRVPHLRPAAAGERPAAAESRPPAAPSGPAVAADASSHQVRTPGAVARAAVAPSGRRPASRSMARRSVRLTRRGRLLLIVLSLALGLALGALLDSWASGAGQGSLRLAGDNSVVVRPGDSLWSIATAVAGTDDVRTVVDEIQQLNHLRGTQVQPGQVLRLP